MTDEFRSLSTLPVSVGSQDIEMGVMRIGEGGSDGVGGMYDIDVDGGRIGGGGGGVGCGEDAVVLEVPRGAFSSSLPRSPTLVDVHVGQENKS